MSRDEIIQTLGRLAIRRQAEVDQFTFEVYADDLVREGVDAEDLVAVCWELGRKPRAEYQPAFPAVGDLLQGCAEIRRNKTQRMWEERRATAMMVTDGKPMTPENAKKWLERIKYAAHHGLPALKARDEREADKAKS